MNPVFCPSQPLRPIFAPRRGCFATILLMLAASASRMTGGHFDAGAPSFASPRQDEIASVHVAVTSVRPWEEYVDALQPKFQLTAEQALKTVLATTKARNEQAARSLGVAIDASVFGGELTNPLTDGSGGGASESFEKPKAKDVPSALTLATNGVVVEPSLQHRAATALYQEVQLMNRAFRDAVEFEAHTPYVVRLQVTVIPRRREAPYDVTSDLAFFLGPPELEMSVSNHQGDLKVVPMLATDSIESALHARSDENMSSLSLALSAVLQSAGIGGSFNHFRDDLTAQLGRDYNSTFTIARLTDNAVRCRFGALAQSATRYSLVPENHFVTLLVFVPDTTAKQDKGDRRLLRLVANNSLTDQKSGRPVKQPTSEYYIRRFQQYLARNQIEFCTQCTTAESRLKVTAQLFRAVAGNEQKEFLRLQEDYLKQPAAAVSRGVLLPDALWADITEMWAGSQYSIAAFQVPQAPLSNDDRLVEWHKTSVGTQAFVMAVDDRKTTTIRLPGFPQMNRELLMARLMGCGSGGLVGGPGQYDEAGQTMLFTFPSLRELGVTDATSLKLDLFGAAWSRPRQTSQEKSANAPAGPAISVNLRYLPVEQAKEKPSPGFKLAATAGSIVMDEKGGGEVTFAVDDVDRDKTITAVGRIQGATITAVKAVSAADAAVTNVVRRALGWSAVGLTEPVVVTLSLSGLNPAKKVQVSAENGNKVPAEAPLEFEVVPGKK